jgi:hypothetical protein
MRRAIWLFCVGVLGLTLIAAAAADVAAQRRGQPRPVHPPHAAPAVTIRGHVFIGGYFYDPAFGPYPWWPRAAYPRWYAPVYDRRADLRLQVTPKDADGAAVYVDGFYAGIVDDFNNPFQKLSLTPGGHTIFLYLEGYRSLTYNVYLRPASTFTLRAVMERLPAGELSEPPHVAPPVPTPPPGSYRQPPTPPRAQAPRPPSTPTPAAGFGTLDLFVQPSTAEVTIDGNRWVTSEEGHFVVQVPAGPHRVTVRQEGYREFTTELEVADGTNVPLNVSLSTANR